MDRFRSGPAGRDRGEQQTSYFWGKPIGELVTQAVKQGVFVQRPLMILLTERVTEEGMEKARQCAAALYRLRMLETDRCAEYWLLQLLSSVEHEKSIAARIGQESMRRQRLAVIKEFHQYPYWEEKAEEILDDLAELLARSCAELPVAVPMTRECYEQARARMGSLTRRAVVFDPDQTGSDAWNGTADRANRADEPGWGQAWGGARAGNGQDAQRESRGFPAARRPEPELPWYRRRPDLLEKELDGARKCFRDVDAVQGYLQSTGQLYWTVKFAVEFGGYQIPHNVIFLYSRDFPDAERKIYVIPVTPDAKGLSGMYPGAFRFVEVPETGKLCIDIRPGKVFPGMSQVEAVFQKYIRVFRTQLPRHWT